MYEQWLKQKSVPDDWKDIFKTWISRGMRYVSYKDIDLSFIICMLVLLAICEQVILWMIGANVTLDLHSFSDASMACALIEQVLDEDTLAEHVTSELEHSSERTYDKRKLLLSSTNLVDYSNLARKLKADSSDASSIANIIVVQDLDLRKY